MFYTVKSWGWRRLLLVAGLTFGAALFAFVTSLEDGQGERVALRWLQFAPVSPVISDAELEWVELQWIPRLCLSPGRGRRSRPRS